MKVELEKTFPMPAAPEVAWAFLQDIEGVAGCMPGAKITEHIDPNHFKGTVSIRVGPASMSFKGDIEVRELNVSQRMLHLVGKGSDTTGSSGASMDLVARVEPAAEGMSQLVGRSEVTMSGKAAAFGGRMMGTVADQLLKQFAANFAARAQALAAASSAPAAASGASGAAPNMRPTADIHGADTVASAAPAPAPSQAPTLTAAPAPPSPPSHAPTLTAAPTPTPPPSRTPTPTIAPTSPPATELNALALLWAIIRDWFRSLFRRRPA